MRTSKINKQILNKVIKEYNSGKSGNEIAKNLHFSPPTIYSLMKKYYIPKRDSSESRKGQHYSPKTEFKKGQKVSSSRCKR